MPGIGGFDVVTQLRENVVSDLLTRLLGDASTQDPTSSGYVPGQLIYPPPPLRPATMIWWDAPTVTLADGEHATLSLALHGGVRQAPSAMDPGRIGTLSGTVTGKMRPVLGTTAGAQHLSLALDTLELGGLRVSYGESNALPLVGIGGSAPPLRDAIVEAVVRDVLSSAMLDALLRGLLTGIGRLPLIYGMGITSLQAARKGASLHVFSAREGSVVAVAVPLPGMVGAPERVENALAQRPESNMAVSVSSVALTAVTMQLLSIGKITRQLRDQSGAEAWLDSIGVQAHAGYLTLTAHLTSGQVKATTALNATLALDRAAARLQLGVGTARVELDALLMGTSAALAARGQAAVQAVAAGLGAAFWGDVLAALLGARYRDGALELVPVVSVPGSGVRVVGTLTGLELEDGHLTLYCNVPADAKYTGYKPDKQPQVTISQPEIPLQTAPAAPVRALVEAQVSTESYPPYDFTWKTSGIPSLLPARGAQLEVTGTPTGRLGDPETIGNTHVALIDSFGQVVAADRAAQAHPAKQKSSRRLRRLVQAAVAAVILAAMTLGGIAFAGGLPFLGGAMPTATATATSAPGIGFVVSPVSPLSVACLLSGAPGNFGGAASLDIVLDNDAGRADTPWQASIVDLAPGGGEPWATFADGTTTASGTVLAGTMVQLPVQPPDDLCRRVYDTKTQQTFHVAVTYGAGSGAGQASATFNMGVSLVSVSVQTTASQSKTSNTTLTQVCNSSTNPVQPFSILLDGSQGTAATPYQIEISDPPPSQGGAVAPTPGGPPVWATADISSGTVAPGGQQTVTITPATNLCAGVQVGQAVNLHVEVQLTPETRPVLVTDTVEALIP